MCRSSVTRAAVVPGPRSRSPGSASAAPHTSGARPTAGSDCTLPRRPASADHDSFHQSAGNSGCGQLAGAKPKSQRIPANRGSPATGVRSGIYRPGRLSPGGGDDGGEHRRLCRHRSGSRGGSGAGLCGHPAFTGAGLCLGSIAQQSSATSTGGAGGGPTLLCDPTGKSPGGVRAAV
jgi:hypothetical protein